jgi:type VI secretion system protein ImpL
VYVLFTKMDGLPGFAEFVSNLGPGESVQAVGAATRPFNAETGGAYAEQTSRLLNQHFADIGYALCDSRVPLLRREQSRARLALEYQFPREFQRLQKNLVQFLVAVGRPSQLQVSAFLRGFYFCGTRKVAVDRPGRQAVAAPAPAAAGALAATTVLNPEMIRAQMAAAQPGAEAPPAGVQITEWLFVPSVFESVLLRDSPARGVSATSLRTDRVRALAFGFLGILGLVVAAGLTTSYVRNRLLEKALLAAARTADPLQRLAQLREPVQSLLDDRSDIGMKWGLYQGNDLLPSAQTIYCSAMKSQVLQPLVGKMAGDLKAISTSGVAPRSSFAVLKAYMMMTTNPEHADAAFLADQLSDTRKSTQEAAISSEAAQQLRYQLLLYGDLLKVPNSKECLFEPGSFVPAAQDYLRNRNLDDDLYQSLLVIAGTGIQAVSYDEAYSNDAVSDSFRVPGYFTKQGWANMQDLLNHPEESLRTDAWVLGESKEFSPEDLSRKAGGYRSRYANEYAQAWKAYLGAATIPAYTSLADAAAKLDKMVGPQSCLLNLIGLAAQHTSIDATMKADFQPAAAVASAPGSFQPGTADYMKRLGSLKNKFRNDSQQGSAEDQSVVAVRTAVYEAQDSVENLASSFQGKPETYQAVKSILLKPITNVQPLLEKRDTDAANDKGKSLCSYMGLYPFSEKSRPATFEDIRAAFDPQTGAMVQLYNQVRDRLDCIGDRCQEKSNAKPHLRSGFADFFSRVSAWRSLLSSGGQLGQIRLSLQATGYNSLKTLTLSIDGQPVTLQPDRDTTITWDLNHSQKLHVGGVFEGGSEDPDLSNFSGQWALFDWILTSEYGSGGTDGLHWVQRTGNRTQTFASGHKKEYKVEIQGPDGPLNRNSLTGSCVLPVPQ